MTSVLNEDSYDEINAELQRMAAIAQEEEVKPSKLYIASGEDFCVSWTFGSPNRLLSTGEEYDD